MVTSERPQVAPDAPVDAAVEDKVQELLRRPYRMVVRGEPDDGYLAEAPELPGCFTAGETPDEALALLRDAMRAWLVVALERGEAIPTPAPAPQQDYSGKFVLRLPKSLHRQLAERAQAEGVSLNQMVLTYLTLGMGMASAGASPATGAQIRRTVEDCVQSIIGRAVSIQVEGVGSGKSAVGTAEPASGAGIRAGAAGSAAGASSEAGETGAVGV